MTNQPHSRDEKSAESSSRHVPTTIRVFCVWAVLVAVAAASVAGAKGSFVGGLLVLVIVAAIATTVIRGSRIAWSLMVGASALRLIYAPFAQQAWWLISIELLNVLLLVLPQSVRYIWGDESVPFSYARLRAEPPTSDVPPNDRRRDRKR